MQQPHTSQPSTIIYSLVKVGELEHLEQLRTTGRMRMARLASYRRLEDDVGRGDPNDGLAGWYQPDKCVLKFRDIQFTGLLEPIKVDFEDTPKHHVFCFHAITSRRLPVIFEDHAPVIDPKMLELGPHALVITNVTELVNRIKEAVKRAKVEMQAGLVEYVDPEVYHGQLGAFRKFNAYAHQSEWRVLVDPSPEEHFWLDLGGSIVDISQIASSSDITSFINLSPGENPTKAESPPVATSLP